MLDFEKLGSFYLGKRFDADADKLTDELVLYDAKDLTTHAVIIGMTGSGKTGLGIIYLEEALLSGVPTASSGVERGGLSASPPWAKPVQVTSSWVVAAVRTCGPSTVKVQVRRQCAAV